MPPSFISVHPDENVFSYLIFSTKTEAEQSNLASFSVLHNIIAFSSRICSCSLNLNASAAKTTGASREKDAVWKAQLARLIWSWDSDCRFLVPTKPLCVMVQVHHVEFVEAFHELIVVLHRASGQKHYLRRIPGAHKNPHYSGSKGKLS